MSLVGSLEDLGLGDILQIVSLSRKSGVLNLNWGEVRGKIIFRDGQVVAALSNQSKPNLGRTLVERGAVSAEELEKLLAQGQGGKTDFRRLLTQEGRVPHALIEQIIKEQIEETVFSFFTWPEGNFNFELMEIEPEIKNLPPQLQAYVLEVGLSPQYLAMEGTRLQDEHRRLSAAAPVGPSRTPVPEPLPEKVSAPAPNGPPAEDDFSSVADFVAAVEAKEKVKTLPAPADSAEAGAGEVSQAAADPAPAARPAEISSELRRPAAEVPAPLPKEAGISPPVTDEGAARLLLVADDEPLLIKSLAYYLEPKGYRVEGFSRVSEAAARLNSLATGEAKPILVADLLMPGFGENNYLGGLELIEQVRSGHPEIPCILMTDYENPSAQARSKSLGVPFFFFKPKSSQLEEDFSSPELQNFVAVLENALDSLTAAAAKPKRRAEPRPDEALVNLGEELRRELGEEEFTPAGETEPTPSRGLAMLKAMISELNDPSSSGQITLLVLRFAAEMMNRAVIFLVARNQIAGLGQFGIELNGVDPEKHVRRMRIPLSEPSIFQETVQKRMVLKKRLRHTKWNDYLIERLGGLEPAEVFVAPIIAGGRIAAILYGDNLPELKEIGDTESLEIFLAQAGLAMEKALLERRIQELRESEPAGREKR